MLRRQFAALVALLAMTGVAVAQETVPLGAIEILSGPNAALRRRHPVRPATGTGRGEPEGRARRQEDHLSDRGQRRRPRTRRSTPSAR